LEVIRHHIKNHLDRAEAELRKVETINKISALNSVRVSTLDQLQLLIATCMERLMSVAEMQAPTPALRNAVESQKNKDSAMIMKTMQGLLALRAEIMGEMKGRGELISVPIDKWREIWTRSLAGLQTKEEKMLVIGIMEELTKANAQ
jgi:ferritin-like metal-binding protein YciE